MLAARNGRSMEAEVRAILEERLSPRSSETGLGSRIHDRFARLPEAELVTPLRREMPRGADFGS
jgi:plasmid stability protein